ncbi:GNAT family N-acetyltransferase [Deinococcus taeanensis]|uniref:GNAT family N-acetyltransferase n=1 Tax=Deinococcus taeanensis TaxID=2737050 RepID=UPI001CDBD13F|nr:GNAT family N-acetyltransferase [Deinococcus taeanensis]UBV42885.1 GNAT family N-acetyltransferase [Deinococcus taeanensis]
MPALFTSRLLLLPLTRAVMTRRLQGDAFTLTLNSPHGPLEVRFGPEWPGDPLPMFPGLLAQLTPGQEEVPGAFIAVTRDTGEAVGQLGVKGPPDAAGEQEIGYGFNPAVWGHGYATEAVQAFTAHVQTQSAVRVVTAGTAVTNPASARVLEKAGFQEIGRTFTEEDGELRLWAHRPE